MAKVKLFVYGTLMKGYRNYKKYFEKANVINIRKAYTKGVLYHLNKKDCPALVEGNEKVWGQLIEFNDDENLTFLKELDDMEKYFENSNEVMYERKEVNVFMENGEREKAYAYIFINIKNMDIYEPEHIVTGDWQKISA
ncbi:gamma-glutamylcyclotransferase family protein [Clostridium sp. Cult2]|uniref:gamma-glutamylcyclotransferase family protein n=1 Tax=Clostridium sp. Cult2 TaxID=2079003 RepID=UPI001F1819B8|nr:gamma-glutamylcyclotransferase family protein [Clostridium sp. Cult2]MCF6464782.1 gamma-glutamylcyclotransferase [Clostridium sp. Cult2]